MIIVAVREVRGQACNPFLVYATDFCPLTPAPELLLFLPWGLQMKVNFWVLPL
jgi:hypothetical protein